jgi:hypothetical protein
MSGVLSNKDSLDPNASADINVLSTHINKRDITFRFNGNAQVISDIGGILVGNVGTSNNLKIKQVRLKVDTAPVGADLIVDININGTTIFTNQANRPTIAAGATTGLSGTPDVQSVSAGDEVSADIDQVGSTTAGGNPIYITVEFE